MSRGNRAIQRLAMEAHVPTWTLYYFDGTTEIKPIPAWVLELWGMDKPSVLTNIARYKLRHEEAYKKPGKEKTRVTIEEIPQE